MNRNTKGVVAGIVLFAVLAGAVKIVRQSQWAVVFSAHPEKQKGNPEGAVTLVEFADFQCPSCANAQPIVRALMKKYPGEIHVIFKHFPLTHTHRWAMMSAIATECAKDQKKFWQFHDQVFKTQRHWSQITDDTVAFSTFTAMGRELGLEIEPFDACRLSPTSRSAVLADIKEGEAKGVSSTPMFYLNEFALAGSGQLFREGARLTELAIRNEKRTPPNQ